MPSFAKPPSFANDVVSMKDVFAEGDASDTLKELLRTARLRAQEVLRKDLPAHILDIQSLLNTAQDESSPLWKGHIKQGLFLAENLALKFPACSEEMASRTDQQDDLRTKLLKVSLQDEFDDSLLSFKGELASNTILIRILDILNTEAAKAMSLFCDLSYWLRLEEPRIEDGNTFGVEIQEHLRERIKAGRQQCIKAFGVGREHYTDRLSFGRFWNRYPNIHDHAQAIANSDRFDYTLAMASLKDLKERETEVLLSMKLNWTKIHDPKNNNGGAGAMMS